MRLMRSYLRPYRWQLAIMLTTACASVATAIVIPLLTKDLIDSAIAKGDKSLLLPIGLAALGLGAAQAVLNFIRRWVQAGAVTGMEQAMRDDLYAHLQRLDTGFHDEWQSGQLLSRATTDLSAIRRFAGFGTIFLVTNVVTFVAVIALLIHLNWWLGLLTCGVFLPVALLILFAALVLPGAGWAFFAFIKVALLAWLVLCIAGIFTASRIRRRVRHSARSGYGEPWHR